MKKNDKAGLEAALKYWWETEFYLKTTGDSKPMASASTDSCLICIDLMENWPKIYEMGGWSDVKPVKLSNVVANADASGGTYLFSTSMDPAHVYKPNGDIVDSATSDGSSNDSWSGSAVFDGESGHWRIDQLVAIK